MTNRELHSFHMSHAVQDAIARDMKRKGNVVYIVRLKFVSIAGVQLTLLYALWNSQYWFIFLGVTADQALYWGEKGRGSQFLPCRISAYQFIPYTQLWSLFIFSL